MLSEKKALSAEVLNAQVALELPDREMMALVNVIALNGTNVALPIGIAANVCGVNADVLAQEINNTGSAECTAENPINVGQGAQSRFGVIQ